MRAFAFVILDEADSITDRYNLDYVDGLSGLGFSISLSKIETDVEDYITKIVQDKSSLSLTVHHVTGYKAGDYLKLWLSKHIDDCLCIEYNNGERVSYIEGKVQKVGETEMNEYGLLEQAITFQPTTPFFQKVENDVRIQISANGKSYPYTYPYQYGINVVENNEIENTYIKDIPLIITIWGTCSNPIIQLLNEDGEIYNEVRFDDVDLGENECIITNAAQKKIYHCTYDDDGNLTEKEDYYYKLLGGYDSYLRAEALITSTISVNLVAGNSGYLTGSRRQYRL